MSERESAEAAVTFWRDPDLYIAMMVFTSVLLATRLVGNEPLNARRLTGEMILSCAGAGVVHAAGLLQGLSGPEYWLMIFLASLGGLRSIEWGLKIFIAVRRVSA